MHKSTGNRNKISLIDKLKEIIDPHLEKGWVKFPRGKLKDVSKGRGTHHIYYDNNLMNKLQKMSGSKYTKIHTHPGGQFFPSYEDIDLFLTNPDEKTSVIVPLDEKTSVPMGYFVMKKRKRNKTNVSEEELRGDLQIYNQVLVLSHDTFDDIADHLKEIADKYHFSFRFAPSKGYDLPEELRGFKTSVRPTSLSYRYFVLILLGLFIIGLGFNNMTGHVIAMNLKSDFTRIFQIGLLVTGSYLSIHFFRKLNILTHCS